MSPTRTTVPDTEKAGTNHAQPLANNVAPSPTPTPVVSVPGGSTLLTQLLVTPPVVGAQIALVGVIVALFGNWFLTWGADRRRWKREDSTRFLADRRAAMERYFCAVSQVERRRPRKAGDDAWDAAWTAQAAVQLACTKTVSALSSDLLQKMEACLSAFTELSSSEEVRTLRAKLDRAVRRDLGMPENE